MKKSTNVFMVLMLGLFVFPCLAAEKTGELLWSKRINLSTSVSGVIKEVYVNVGDHVNKGQSLIKLDDRLFQSHVKQAKAVLIRATETYKEAKRELERARELFDRDAISVHEKQLVEIEYSNTYAHLQEAEAVLTQASLDLEYSTIKAPIAGIVVQKNIEVGETINNSIAANTMMVIAGNKEMVAQVHLTSQEIMNLSNDSKLDVKIGDVTMPGVVVLLGQEPVLKDDVVKYTLHVRIKRQKNLRPGQMIQVMLP